VLQIATGNQIFDEQSRYDRLGGTVTVGKQKARMTETCSSMSLLWEGLRGCYGTT